ncbi:hypothetical protein [Paenibacillus agaridevorans]|uniref:hypothetical protein n=1 Tax=Paenibacillus agaridevorans TaxID=171404 RepID=UPI0011B25751|nr:hypothetical protein [Paenibacillus agaridevorans]
MMTFFIMRLAKNFLTSSCWRSRSFPVGAPEEAPNNLLKNPVEVSERFVKKFMENFQLSHPEKFLLNIQKSLL